MNNIIIKGFNAINKIITKGYAQFNGGISVKICRLHAKVFISHHLKAREFISHSLHSKKYISQLVKSI